MIELTNCDNGKPIFVNPDRIMYVRDFGSVTAVVFSSGNDIRVSEDIQEVMRRISGRKT